jgi:glycosyltransferase involved in cell wall biosynthesis
MRLHYLSDSVVPSVSANSVHVMKMCSAFGRHGHEVVLSAYRGAGSADVYAYYDALPNFAIAAIRHSRLPGVKRFLRALSGAAAVRRRPPPDLIYGRDLYSVLAAASSSRIPFIYESHMAPRSAGDRYLTARLLENPRLRQFVVISQGLADAYAALYPWFPAKKLLIAHDGADEPATHEGERALAAWPGRAGVVQLGYVGSLFPGKGAEVVIELAGRLPGLDFHVVGGKPEDVARIRGAYRGGNLFLHGYVEHRRVPALMSRMDIALLPPQKNVLIAKTIDIGAWMSPLKLFEYMAARLPIVSSALPVIEEVLTNEVDALLVPAGDLDAWAAAVERLARDEALRNALAERGYEEFTSRYTWSARAERVLRSCSNP